MTDIQPIINNKEIKDVIDCHEFYFQKGQDVLKQWLHFSVSGELENKLLSLSKDYDKIQEEAKTDKDLNKVLTLLFTIIAYCDTKAKDKNVYNQYEDKRALEYHQRSMEV